MGVIVLNEDVTMLMSYFFIFLFIEYVVEFYFEGRIC